MLSHPAAQLNRETFSISREAEYFSESELVTQTGYPKRDWWPFAIVKELADNGLDSAEQAGLPPMVSFKFTGDSLTVADTGPGIDPAVVTRILDFSTRTSDKVCYVSPTRGAQGNAIKSIAGVLYVLNGGGETVIVIESRGIRHNIHVGLDQVAKRPRIIDSTERVVKKPGFHIHLSLNSACSKGATKEPENLPKLLADYAFFNPHATFRLVDGNGTRHWAATAPDWQKWLPSDPTSAHWYDVERLEGLLGAYISNGASMLVRDFVGMFRGLSSTTKRAAVCRYADLDRTHLDDLVVAGKFDPVRVRKFLDAMQDASAPVRPEALGILGRDHFENRLRATGKTFRYARKVGIDDRMLPFSVEAAFAMTDDETLRGPHIGLNWAVPLTNPLRGIVFKTDDGYFHGVDSLLAHNCINFDRDPVCCVVHVACPRFDFLDRGKSSLSLPEAIVKALTDAIHYVTKEWAAIKKKEFRQQQRAEREREQYQRGRSCRVTIKEAAWAEMPAAYMKASGEGHWPAHGRQIYYAARGAILKLTGTESLDANYFTQTLLPDYQRENAEETADWDVVYDARGHFFEPHTGREVPLGTIAVRQYLSDTGEPVDADIPHPDLSTDYPTVGPLNRFGAVLLIEKEGFGPLLEKARFAERYDLAIMSSKGMNTTAARKLIDFLPDQVPIFVLHDFDKAGFSILATLTKDNRRYSFSNAPRVVDLGLRLADVKKWKLEAEDVHYGKSDPSANLKSNGATPDEIAFLSDRKDYHGHHGKRVELNAFMSDRFVKWLDLKLRQQGVKKVIPRKDVLEKEYRRQAAIARLQKILDEAHIQVAQELAELKAPHQLGQQINKILAENPALPWDKAVVLAHEFFRTAQERCESKAARPGARTRHAKGVGGVDFQKGLP